MAGEVKAKLQDAARLAEEDALLSASRRTLSDRQVRAATSRNYEAASEMQWKRLAQRSIAEKQRHDEERVECTFRPVLTARYSTEVESRYMSWPPPTVAVGDVCRCRGAKHSPLTSCASSTEKPRASSHVPQGSSPDVFERLYRSSPPTLDVLPPPPPARVTANEFRDFLARQENDAAIRQVRACLQSRRVEVAATLMALSRSQSKLDALAAQNAHSHAPKLTRRTRELCATLRSTAESTKALLERDHLKRMRRLEKWQDLQCATDRMSSRAEFCADKALSPPATSDLVSQLLQQEQRMKAIARRQ